MLNLTPHPITIYKSNKIKETIQPSGKVARVKTKEKEKYVFNQIQIIKREFGEVENLPAEGTPCLVSSIVLSAVPNRSGVFAPDTGKTAIRDENGKIIAVTRLICA